jgi:hypothetical protein
MRPPTVVEKDWEQTVSKSNSPEEMPLRKEMEKTFIEN